MKHLDERVIEDILDGRLSRAEQDAWRAHLAAGCAECERACVDGPDLDVLARLLHAELAAPVAPDPATRARVAAAVLPVVPANRAWAAWTGLALVAAAALAVVLVDLPESPTTPGPDLIEKGDLVAPSLELEVLAGHAEGGKIVVDGRVGADGPVSRGQLLLFQVSTDAPAARVLWVVEGDGAPVFLTPEGGGVAPVEPKGTRRATTTAGEVAYDLSDVTSATVQVWAAASKVPLDSKDALVAADRGLPGVSVTSFTIAMKP